MDTAVEQVNRDDADRVKQIFADALELDADKALLFVARTCGDDADLRAKVEALLSAHVAAGRFLSSPEYENESDLATVPPSAARPDTTPAADGPSPGLQDHVPLMLLHALPGSMIDRYQVDRLIGEGGFSHVFAARQTQPIQREVAIKILKIGMDTAQVVARFEAERQALALMDHPNIARVIDAGATPAGRAYFVMELVDGVPVTTYCDAHRLTIRQRLELFLPICQAIQHAHQKGIIHRDLKPSNILVLEREGKPIPKVIDFGIAKAIASPLGRRTLLTQERQLIGTPQYMSPEQADMDTAQVDTRSDIYSLGTVLYELLTGCTPLDEQLLRDGGYLHMLRTLRHVDPPRPSARLRAQASRAQQMGLRASDGAKLARHVAGDLDWIVMKALEKDPDRRYATAAALEEDVRRYLNNEPVLAGPPGAGYRARKFVLRHKASIAAACLIVLALGIGLGTATVALYQARAALQRATRAEESEGRLRIAEVSARRDAVEKLWASYLAQARTGRLDGRPGQRFDGLRALAAAARIRPSLSLRNEAIACLALPDLRLDRTWVGPVAGDEKMAFTPSLDRYARSDARGTIHICRRSDDHEIATLSGATKPVGWGMGFSPDGRYVAAVYPPGGDGFMVWDVDHQRPVLRLHDPPTPEDAFDFSPDSASIAVAQGRNHLSIYPLMMGQIARTIPTEGAVEQACFHPGGKLIATYQQKVGIQIIALDNGKVVRTIQPRSSLDSFAWDPRGQLLAGACRDHCVYVWDAATGEQRAEMEGHLAAAVRVAFTHSGQWLLSTGWDYTARLWDPLSGFQALVTDAPGYWVQFAPGDRSLTTGTGAFSLQWGVEEGGECRTLQGPPSDDRGWNAEFTPDGRFLASVSRGGVRVWDPTSGLQVAHLPLAAMDFTSILFTPDGKNLVTSGSGGVQRWPVQRDPSSATRGGGISFGQPQTLDGFGHASALSRDGRTLIYDRGAGHLGVIDLMHVDQVTIIDAGPAGGLFRSVAVSNDGRWAATSERTGRAFRIWDLTTHKLAIEFPSSTADLNLADVAFSPDGRWLVTGDVGAYRFWEVGSWKLHHQVPRALSPLPAMVAFTESGRAAAVVIGSGHTVQLIDVARGVELATLEGPQPHQLCDLSLSRDGAYLAIANEDHSVTLWDIRRVRKELRAINLDWD